MRPLAAPRRIGRIAAYAGDLYQLCACSELENAMTTIPFGGASQSRPSVLPPQTTKWPSNAALGVWLEVLEADSAQFALRQSITDKGGWIITRAKRMRLPPFQQPGVDVLAGQTPIWIIFTLEAHPVSLASVRRPGFPTRRDIQQGKTAGGAGALICALAGGGTGGSVRSLAEALGLF